ncbi:MAG: hypothetical protein ACNA8W_22580, partial [Bradymonadaceae bacterium]
SPNYVRSPARFQPFDNDLRFLALYYHDDFLCALTTDYTLMCRGTRPHNETPPVIFSEGDNLRDFDLVNAGRCLVDSTGALRCSSITAIPPGEGPFLRVSTIGHWTCALDEAGEISCSEPFNSRLTPPPLAPPFSDVQVTESGGCGLRPGGDVVCWGLPALEESFEVQEKSDFVKIASGGSHICGLTSAGKIRCWGRLETMFHSPP